ncbi:MAG: Glutamate synthase [NADPH] small chain [Acidimicrobiaceae bacterium]|nr:MAG: Glutamate synthase [NADPH] small chain [Acidimicrobiaceae bacterium]
MGDARGFLEHDREVPERRPVSVRIKDWKEVYEDFPKERLQVQASRCMDCGIPFCNSGCPLGNLIPEWNDLVYRDQWEEASHRLHATNNFPEFTGRLCPAPCEGSCVLGINEPPVTIKQVEVSIIDHAWEMGWVKPVIPQVQTGKRIAVVGSGPAGLAAAQQLTRVGHEVVVFEKADRIGGLLRYGIPEFKLEKRHLDRRLAQMEVEGTEFRANTEIGVDISAEELKEGFDAVVLAGGATQWRDLPIPGRELKGIHQAMEYLPQSNRIQEGDRNAEIISAEGKKVVIIGGGDTGADCLGTALRQGAEIVNQFEIMPRPPEDRSDSNPWPTWPLVYRVSSAHEEGGKRIFAINTSEFSGDNGNVKSLKTHKVEQVFENGKMFFEEIENSEEEIEADLVLLALGFTGPETSPILEQLGVALDKRGNVDRSETYETSIESVFTCGDMGRGQSLIVWAIAEGRSCAASVDEFLMGTTELPRSVSAKETPLI